MEIAFEERWAWKANRRVPPRERRHPVAARPDPSTSPPDPEHALLDDPVHTLLPATSDASRRLQRDTGSRIADASTIRLLPPGAYLGNGEESPDRR